MSNRERILAAIVAVLVVYLLSAGDADAGHNYAERQTRALEKIASQVAKCR